MSDNNQNNSNELSQKMMKQVQALQLITTAMEKGLTPDLANADEETKQLAARVGIKPGMKPQEMTGAMAQLIAAADELSKTIRDYDQALRNEDQG